MRCDFALLASVLVSVGLSATSSANLFLNSGFEEGTVDANGFGSVPSPWIPVYSLADTYDDTGVTAMSRMEGFGTPYLMDGVKAYEGHRFLGIHTPWGGYSPDGVAQMMVAPLSMGMSYTVSAYMLADDRGAFAGTFANLGAIQIQGIRTTGGTDNLGVLAANSVGLTWERRSVSFTAAYDYQYLIFAGYENSPSAYMGVDAVELVAVPEPGTLAALALGVVAGLRRKK